MSGENTELEEDKRETAFPIFCLTKPTEDYWDKFNHWVYNDPGGCNDISFNGSYEWPTIAWSEIPSKAPHRDQVLADIEANLGKLGPWPFLGSSVGKIYEYWKKVLRPADDSVGWEPFTNYVFIVIDEQSVKAEPQECIVCCDAPDYDDPDNDDELPKLKQLRVSLPMAVRILTPLEQLAMTPSESLNATTTDATALASFPPFTMRKVLGEEGDDRKYSIATPAEARWAKARACQLRPEHLGDKILDDERDATLFLVGMEETKIAATLHGHIDMSSRKKGTTVQFHTNSTKPKTQEEAEKGPGGWRAKVRRKFGGRKVNEFAHGSE